MIVVSCEVTVSRCAAHQFNHGASVSLDARRAAACLRVCCQVSELLTGRVVVGHSINKDLKVLLLSHPRKDIRDTAK